MQSLRPKIVTSLFSRSSNIVSAQRCTICKSISSVHQQTRRVATTRRHTTVMSQNTSAAQSGLQPAESQHLSSPGTSIAQKAGNNRAASSSCASVAPQEPIIHDIFESKTSTWQYVVADPKTLAAVIIDPVLDYDPATHILSTNTADALLGLICEKGYKIERILETHAHADHITAASYLQDRLERERGHRPLIGIGKRIVNVQELFSQRYGVPADEFKGVFDVLFDDNDTFDLGELKVTVMHLPGHTPDHLGYKIGDNVFCGDSVFHTDIGTARCDFPGGSANNLFYSAHKLLSLPDNVKIWTGHDYPSGDRKTPVPWQSVADHKEQNKHLRVGITEEEFVALRRERDATLGEPRLLHQSLQMNIRAGKLPKQTDSRHRLLHLPLKLGVTEW
ncbi:hypothetical protein jhhlp_004912 [Lomentospora prolificans]|uniref:Metallo-beta-lactamase domain-containing protein n=1 Tax=Lomentospora prolificans TaxID=41688 RepID=A0A2N3N808_9PEZI|nr:hypothetical protein jhhlp_004912 [Lomentospora prolificans]